MQRIERTEKKRRKKQQIAAAPSQGDALRSPC
jgi:hypothetical protein